MAACRREPAKRVIPARHRRREHPMNRTMVALAVLSLVACTNRAAPQPVEQAKVTPAASSVERGRLLVSIGGCSDCHTPMKFDPAIGMPVPQMDRLLSGHPEGAADPASNVAGHDQAIIGPTFTSFRLPFGIVYAANLTPDRETGLGDWTEERFVRALRSGRHHGDGRPILPPMPWMTLASQSDDDLKAIYAYLRTIPPVRNRVAEATVPPQALEQIAASYEKVRTQQAAAAATGGSR
jgi:cytochrome c553